MIKTVKLSICFAVAVLSVSPVYAQFFGGGAEKQPQSEQPRQVQKVEVEQAKTTPAMPTTAAQQAIMQNNEKEALSPFNYEKNYIPQTNNAKSSGEPRVKVFSKDENADKELILLNMEDYKVYKTSSGQTRCSMRFVITTTLPTKVSNISYRLKWPNMETALSFNNVEPQVGNQYKYTLIGDGCYSMDKSPNIIINRCRVKGMTQQTCASKVRWIVPVQ